MTRSEAALRRDADFEQIEAAVMETARGRWFLAEFVRRNRNADTVEILNGLRKLEAVVRHTAPAKASPQPQPQQPQRSEDVVALRRDVAAALGHVRDAETRMRASIAGLDPMSTERAQLRVALSLYEAASTKLGAVLGELAPPKAKPAERRATEPRARSDVFFEPSALLSRLSGLATLTPETTTASATMPALLPIPAAVSERLDAVLNRLIQPEARPDEPPAPPRVEPAAEPVAAKAEPAPMAQAVVAPRLALPAAKVEALPTPEPIEAPSVSSRSVAALRVAAAVQLDRQALNRPAVAPRSEASAVPARPAVAPRMAATVRFDRNIPEPPIADDPTASMSRGEKIALFS